MGVETAVAAAIITSAFATGASAYTNYKAGKAQQKEMAKANELARQQENERKREAEELKAEKRKERMSLVDDMRAQLGAGLGTDVMSTKFKKSAQASSGETLG